MLNLRFIQENPQLVIEKLQKKNFESFPEEENGEYTDDKLREFKWIRVLEKVDLGCFVPQNLQPLVSSIEA